MIHKRLFLYLAMSLLSVALMAGVPLQGYAAYIGYDHHSGELLQLICATI